LVKSGIELGRFERAAEALWLAAERQDVGRRGKIKSSTMNPTIVGIIVFACTLGGALVGNWLRTILPDHHLDDESRDTVKLGIGLIATMTALVLGLVTASAKSSFDAMDTAVKHTAMDILTLDRLLARYGPETGEIRGALQQAVASRIDTMWPQNSSRPADLDPIRSGAAPGAESSRTQFEV
jgi:hypothetical protein